MAGEKNGRTICPPFVFRNRARVRPLSSRSAKWLTSAEETDNAKRNQKKLIVAAAGAATVRF